MFSSRLLSCRISTAVSARTFSSKITHHPFSKHLSGSVTQFADFIVDRAEGCWVYGTNGKKYLDWNTGIGVTSLGHCHPNVVKAAYEQMQKGIHLQVNCVTSQPMINLAEKLVQNILPKGLDQVFFANSGAEAIENAIKVARHATGRTNVIVFQGSFHGRTIATSALTTSKTVYRAGFQPLMSGVFVAPFPYCLRCPVSCNSNGKINQDHCCNRSIEEIRLLLKQQTAPEETAAILFEPILGEGGYVVPPMSFFKQLRQIADETGALLIADEVQSGFGRTGEYFAINHAGVVPDILVMAKGIASGFPLSAIAAPARILSKAKPGSIGGTYGGNAVSLAAANAVADYMSSPEVKLLENVRARGKQLREGLLALQKKYPIADVRGLGLMQAFEFDASVPAGTASKLSKTVLKHGMLLLNTGIYETLRIIPALTISKEEIDIGLGILEKGLEELFPSRK